MAQATLTKTGSNAQSVTFAANDADGIYRVEAWYATADYRHHKSLGQSAANCPGNFTVTFSRHLTISGHRAPLKEVTIYDCSHSTSGSHEQTVFNIDGQGDPTRTRIQEMPHHTQRLREALQQMGDRLEENERRQKQLLGLILILMLLTLWSALGPLFL